MQQPGTVSPESFDPRASGAEVFSLKQVVAAVRHRWYIVLPVFAVVAAVGTWRTLQEQRRYRADATVRVQQRRPSIPGMGGGLGGVDYRYDRMTSEQRIIVSRPVAQAVAQAEGLRLRIAKPASMLRSMVFGEQPLRVDSAAPTGEYGLVFGERDVQLVTGATVLAAAPYGTALSARGITLTVPERPAIDEERITLEVLPLEFAIGEVQGGLGTSVVEKTDIIQISYTGTDPILVQRLTDRVATEYAAFSMMQEREQQQKKTRFIAQNLDEQRDSLLRAQDALQGFRESNQLTDVTGEQLALQERIQQFETTRREAQLEMNVFNSLLSRTSAVDDGEELRRIAGSEAVSKNANIKTLFDRWYELERERQTLRTRRGDTNEDVMAVDSLIVRTKQDLQSASNAYTEGLKARIAQVDEQLRELRRQTTRFPSLSAAEKNFNGRVFSMQKVYDDLQQQYQLARIDQSVEDSPIQLIDRATRPVWPVSPNRKRDVLLSAALGLLIGTLLAVLLDRLDTSIRSPDEVKEMLDIPVLGMIPAIRIDAGRAVDVPATALERLVTHADPRSPVAESYRSLRTNLAFARANQAVRVLVLTSPGPADGKSTTVANLAITFAQQGQRTLVVDADLRRAVLDKTFGVPRSPGLTEVIIGSVPLSAACHETPIPNLMVMGSGQFPPNPSELLGSPAMVEILAEAREMFDVVLFDTPPLLAVTDAAVLSTMVDGTILVVRVGKTAREAARRALGQLRSVHARVLGTLLNDVSVKAGGYYGGYGYTYYAYYGTEGEEQANGSNGRGGVMTRLRRLGRKEPAGRGGK